MTDAQIRNKLAKIHPDYTYIGQNEYGLWDVEFEDEFELVMLTYKVEGERLRFIGEMTVEQ